MKHLLLTVALLLFSLSANAQITKAQSSEPTVTITVINSNGIKIGKAVLSQQADTVRLRIEAQMLPPGTHGIHFHETGRCDAPDFTTAGSHFNPTSKEHGFHNPKGFHSGDLLNIEVGSDGKVMTELESKTVTLKIGQPNSLLQKNGTSLIIHEKADDYVTDPSGNSGKRIACGVIK